MISIARLKERLAYDPKTGHFRWLKCRHEFVGKIAGSNNNGYRHILIDGILLKGHRIAWAMTYGEWPSDEIDHRNGNGLDNRIDNLRLATRSQNNQNKMVYKNNVCGIKGVHFIKDKNAYSACITVNGKRTYLGYFKKAKEAGLAYREASKAAWGEYSTVTSRGA